MKAVVVARFGGPEVLEYQEVEAPAAGRGQVLIEVAATSVNYADIKARRGDYHLGKKPPFVPGLEVVGTIAALGPGVRRLRPGQRVVAFPLSGAYAEFVVATAVLTVPIPPEVGTAAAAAFPLAATTAYHALVKVGRLRRRDHVLIHGGAGGVGTAAIQLARLLGAERVYATTGSEEKTGLLAEMGAEPVLVPGDTDHAAAVRALAGGRGLDVILNPYGGRSLEADISLLAPFGRLVSTGSMFPQQGTMDAAPLHHRNLTVAGFSFGFLRRTLPAAARKSVETVAQMVAAGQVRPVIGRRFPLAEAAAAHRWLESRANVGKVILEVKAGGC